MTERQAYFCEACAKDEKHGGVPLRVFRLPGDPEPRCNYHGKMIRQPNKPYRGARPK